MRQRNPKVFTESERHLIRSMVNSWFTDGSAAIINFGMNKELSIMWQTNNMSLDRMKENIRTAGKYSVIRRATEITLTTYQTKSFKII